MNTNKKVSAFDKPYSEEVARLYIMSFFPGKRPMTGRMHFN